MKLFPAILLALLLSGCSAKYLTITDQVIPPREPAVSQYQRLTLLDRSGESDIGLRLESGVIFSQGNPAFLRECAARLPTSCTVISKRERDSDAGSPAPVLDRTEVQTFLGPGQALFCLEQLFFQETVSFQSFQKHQLDERGNDYYINAVIATKRSLLQSMWRLYDGQTGQVIVALPYVVEEMAEVEALNRVSAQAKLDSLYPVDPAQLQQQMLDRLIADVNPTAMVSNWLYYTKGNALTELSAFLLEAGNYEAAIELLEANQTTLAQRKKPERTVYNWAVALLLSGDTAAALRKAREGYSAYGKSDFLTLIKKMENNG